MTDGVLMTEVVVVVLLVLLAVAGMAVIRTRNLFAAVMLAGIYSGDWGAGIQIVNADRARLHLVQILAHWEDSREAQYVKNNLRWSDEKGENQYEFYPSNALASLF